MELSPSSVTVMTATPVTASWWTSTRSQLTPLWSRTVRSRLPKSSSPTAPTMNASASSLAAASA